MLNNLQDSSRAFKTANFVELLERGVNYFSGITLISTISLIIYGKVIRILDTKKA